MKAIDRPFTKIINGASQFVIPVFQRDYTWQAEPQCSQLWRDVIRAAHQSGAHGHFLGSVVYIATGDSTAGFTRWLLIDGQQRLTTLTLLLLALRDHIRETGWKGDEDAPTPKRIEAYYLKNIQEEGDREQKLVLRRHDQATLRALLDRTEMPAQASKRIVENYRYFRDQMADADPGEVYQGIDRLVVVDVALDRQTDDPQLIFESLNSTGVDLSQSDLIRNFILMRLPEREQTSLYETYWSKIELLFRGAEWTFDAFARDYVALKTQAAKQEKASEIYYAFREFFPGLAKECGSLEAALADMLRYARHYAAFSLGRGAPGPRARALARLRHLVDVPGLLVMRLLECREATAAFTEDELVEGLSLIESYVLRRAICGQQTRGYWQVFASIAFRISPATPLADLKVAFARQRDSYRFPADDEFGRALMDGDIYGLRVCRHLLECLENHGTREPTDTSNYSIEHIMPQNERLTPAWRAMLGEKWRDVHKAWLHRLGNLTLTGYNSTYSDRPFEDKKTIPGGFAESSVRLNKYVREQPVWTEAQMEQRGAALAKTALNVWPALSVPKPLIDQAKKQEMIELAARRDVANVKMGPEARALFEELRQQIRALAPNIIELAEPNSVSYHADAFFLEALPRKYKITILLPLDFNEIDDQTGLAEDATQWKFFIHARYSGGVSADISNVDDVSRALPLIKKALAASFE